MTQTGNVLKIGITHGDINGISYEIIIKALLDNRLLSCCTPIVYGSPKIAAYHRKTLNIENFSLNHIKTPGEANPKRPNVINCLDDNVRVELGKCTDIAGNASLRALERAIRDLKSNQIDLLVTAPISKKNVQEVLPDFTGHTEYLAKQFDCLGSELMLMVHSDIKVALVTTHIPVSEIPKYITIDQIVSKLRILNNSLKEDFNIRKPRIAVLSLNPHAGDAGLLGNEEKEIITPAIEQVQKEDIMAFGPYPSDGFFGSAHFTKFDAVLAMYHDQGMTPFKVIAFDTGVNYTAGLPIIRTSPTHGTAFELAGENKASENSLRQAVYLAIDIYNNRKANQELRQNALLINEDKH